MLHDLIKNPSRLFGLVLTPTRELAYQIAEQIDKLGHELKVKTVTLVGEWTPASQVEIAAGIAVRRVLI